MRLITYFSALGLALCSSVAEGYKEATHQMITEAAFDRSVLQLSPAVLQDMGLSLSSEFPNTSGAPRTIRGLLTDGTDFEDSIFPTIRVLRHFYNPVNGEGLNVSWWPTGMSSPDWALARPGTVSAQERSYWNARQSLFDALTKPLEAERQAAFGEAFQFLGQVTHHLQDMAQPQHVRNDGHFILTNPSLYEERTNDVRNSLPVDFAGIGYNIIGSAFTSTFNSPRSFWNTLPAGPNSPFTGKGIAEFTNRNFVSAGTNFVSDATGFRPNPNFALPVPGPAGSPTSIAELIPGTSLQGELEFVQSLVVDNFLGGTPVTNLRASTYSTLDQDLIDRGGAPVFSLNRFNFEAAHGFLIPRAVAYSAGMINYFFRGKIDLVEDPSNSGTFVIKNLGNETITGTFTLHYDYDAGGTVNNRFEFMSWDREIPAGGQVNIGTIPDPTNPAPKNPGEYMLVFKGNMGAETTVDFGAVVGKVVNIGWSIINLGPAIAHGINNSGQIVGGATFPAISGERAFLRSGGSMQNLGTLPGAIESRALGVNDNGQVVGLSNLSPVIEHAFSWSSSSGMLDLGTLPGGSRSQANAVNSSGQVVGWATDASGFQRAFLWSSGSGMLDLGTIPGFDGSASYAFAINDSGQVVGPIVFQWAAPVSGNPEWHAFLWSGGSGMQDLGRPSNFDTSIATSISNNGQIAGYGFSLVPWAHRAILLSGGSGWQDLGTLPGTIDSFAFGVNDNGQVVGESGRAFLWSSASGMQDLSALPAVIAAGWTSLDRATAINNAGQIVGYGTRNGSTYGFLLNSRRMP